MLSMNEYLILFSLPHAYEKNQNKILHNENIWNKLCEYNNNWKGYPDYELIKNKSNFNPLL